MRHGLWIFIIMTIAITGCATEKKKPNPMDAFYAKCKEDIEMLPYTVANGYDRLVARNNIIARCAPKYAGLAGEANAYLAVLKKKVDAKEMSVEEAQFEYARYVNPRYEQLQQRDAERKARLEEAQTNAAGLAVMGFMQSGGLRMYTPPPPPAPVYQAPTYTPLPSPQRCTYSRMGDQVYQNCY